MSEREAWKALEVWMRAFETGRSEPLYVARDHTARLFADALSAAPSPVDGGEGSEDDLIVRPAAPHAAQGPDYTVKQRSFTVGNGGMIRQSVSAPESAVGEAEPSAVGDLTSLYVPVAIHFEETDTLEYVQRDVPTITRPVQAGMDLLLDVATREPIGWRIYGWSRIAPDASPLPLPEPGEGNAAVADSAATREPISRAATETEGH